jgi:SpoVK/Ycf46/Vps4 family AAA+-type ATPase
MLTCLALVSFFVDDISPMVWNDKAYEHLVYDEQQKDLVLSFVENHGQRKTAEDVILGKGQGLIILLSGPQGTGKTLMAEAVADRTHKPLFYLQAEDLGINPATLGSNIKKVFEMATEWDAVILLDEADVFMAERNPNDIARNELVSIFLRELEYFRGIIFLTTNLYSTIDSAFRSRVSLHLLFKPLPPAARLLVWQKFLDRLPPPEGRVTELADGDEEEKKGNPAKDSAVAAGKKPAAAEGAATAAAALAKTALTEEDLAELSLWQLNGREIKNAVKMVRAWCDNKAYNMTLARLESGIRVTSPHAGKQGSAAGRDADSLYD